MGRTTISKRFKSKTRVHLRVPGFNKESAKDRSRAISLFSVRKKEVQPSASCKVLYSLLRSKSSRIYPGHFKISKDQTKSLKRAGIVNYEKINGSNQYLLHLKEKYEYMHLLFQSLRKSRGVDEIDFETEELLSKWEDHSKTLSHFETLATNFFQKGLMYKFAMINHMFLKKFNMTYPDITTVPRITRIVAPDDPNNPDDPEGFKWLNTVADELGKRIPHHIITKLIVGYIYGGEDFFWLGKNKYNIPFNFLIAYRTH